MSSPRLPSAKRATAIQAARQTIVLAARGHERNAAGVARWLTAAREYHATERVQLLQLALGQARAAARRAHTWDARRRAALQYLDQRRVGSRSHTHDQEAKTA